MVWDGLIVMLIFALAIAGWNVGIINSWRGPLALIIATVATQQFYVDFATWIVQQLRVPPDQAIVMGYLLLWGAIEIIAELLLSMILPYNRKTRPLFFERAAGAGLGVFKCLLVAILPAIALTGPINVPAPPADKSALITPIESGVDKAALLPLVNKAALALAPVVGPIVISRKSPSFKADFNFENKAEEPSQKSHAVTE